jgi:hypothetical protein
VTAGKLFSAEKICTEGSRRRTLYNSNRQRSIRRRRLFSIDNLFAAGPLDLRQVRIGSGFCVCDRISAADADAFANIEIDPCGACDGALTPRDSFAFDPLDGNSFVLQRACKGEPIRELTVDTANNVKEMPHEDSETKRQARQNDHGART